MTVHPLDSYINPASIAVFGASPDETKLRGRVTHLLRKNRYAGRLYPVNPSHREIHGLECYPDIAAVPGPVDLAIIVVPAAFVVAALEQCAAKPVKHALILTSGFSEQGGEQVQAQETIAEIARRTGIRVCGPNAEGFHNETEHISATFSPAVDLRPETLFSAGGRRVGVIAQSGGIGFALYHRGRLRGLSFSRVVTVGNEADLTVADFLDHMAGDQETGAILLFLETVRRPEAFMAAAARAAAARKPIVVVKVGRSVAGGRATASHTGSMAGWDAAYDAVFKQYGMIVTDDLDYALGIVAALTTCPLPGGNRAAVMTVSGGGGALVADALVAAGLDLPVLSTAIQDVIRPLIPSYGATRNPVDVTGQATRTGAPLRTIQLLEQSDEIDIIVAVTTMSNETRTPVDVAGLRELVTAQRKPILFFSYTVASEFGLRGLAEAGSVTYMGLSELAEAARGLVSYAAFTPPKLLSDRARPAPDLLERLGSLSGVLSEHESKTILAQYGIGMLPSRLVAGTGELDAAVAAVGFPLAIKIQSRDLPHKSEVGGVRLHIRDAAGAADALQHVHAAAAQHAPTARIDGVLVERMAASGTEIIIGLVRDDTFGPMLTVGAGGTATELFKDVSRRPAPVSEADALQMLHELRSFPLLDGFRGAAKADVAALVRLIVQVSHVMADCPRVREVELNPVLVHPSGAGVSVADALVVMEEAHAAGS
jgi:acyl-CoA synthetase (NDP forming)